MLLSLAYEEEGFIRTLFISYLWNVPYISFQGYLIFFFLKYKDFFSENDLYMNVLFSVRWLYVFLVTSQVLLYKLMKIQAQGIWNRRDRLPLLV